MDAQQIKAQICDVCHKMWTLGWVAANDGILYKLNPQDGHVISFHIIGMPVLNRPCADAKRIYVSDCFGRIMAIEK